jgi:hypothetical protein
MPVTARQQKFLIATTKEVSCGHVNRVRYKDSFGSRSLLCGKMTDSGRRSRVS